MSAERADTVVPMGGTWTIRTATEEDLDVLADVFRRSSLSSEGEGDRALLEAHPEVLVLDPAPVRAGRTRVAVDGDDRVLGFASTSPNPDWSELDDLFVAPEHQRSGIGRLLVEDAVALAAAAGLARLEVTGNDGARVFYERAGFTCVGRVATPLGPTAGRFSRRVRP